MKYLLLGDQNENELGELLSRFSFLSGLFRPLIAVKFHGRPYLALAEFSARLNAWSKETANCPVPKK